MLKILLTLILMTSPAMAITNWGVNNAPTSAADLKSNFPAEVLAQWTILQTLLQNYRQGYSLIYSSSSAITVSSGEISAWNGAAALFLQNTGSQSINTSNLDTGSSFSSSTTYYVYAGTSSVTAASATISISLNNTAPSNLTYYKQLGSFITDSSGNIGNIIDNGVLSKVGAPSTQSTGTTYQAQTDGWLRAFTTSTFHGSNSSTLVLYLYSDSSPTPTAQIDACGTSSSTTQIFCSVSGLIRKGNYYTVTNTTGSTVTMTFTPTGQ